MPLVSSNTYTEPTAGTSLNTARIQQNDSFRSLLVNFKSTAAPSLLNIVIDGVASGEQDGMLYRSATTNALYISDSVHKKSSPVGGNFTRVGIGNRVENGIVALGANATTYEIGELVATVSQDGTIASNSRLYLCVSNTSSAGSTSNFIDVGSPLGYSIGALNNVTFSGQSVIGVQFKATSNVGIKTDTLTGDLTIGGTSPRIDLTETGGSSGYNNSVIMRDADVLMIQTRSGDTLVSTDYRVTSNSAGAVTHEWRVANSERMRLDGTGSLGIGGTAPDSAALSVTSTTKGFLGPRLTTTQRDAIVSPAEGLLIYNTTLGFYQVRTSSAWTSVGGGASGGGSNQVFYENDTTVSSNYTLSSNKNAMSAGPITINSGVSVTIPSGQVWTIV